MIVNKATRKGENKKESFSKEHINEEPPAKMRADPCEMLINATGILATKHAAGSDASLTLRPFEAAVYRIETAISQFPYVAIGANDTYGELCYYIKDYADNYIKIFIKNSSQYERFITIYVI